MPNENEARWYVLHTYSGYENKVATNIARLVENRGLEHLIFETKIPLEPTSEAEEQIEEEVVEEAVSYDEFDDEYKPKKPKKEKKKEEAKLFPSYVLVKMIMNDESWTMVRNIRGVTGFVGPESKPVALTEAEMASLGVEASAVKIDFAVGDSVTVVAGPLVGSMVTVKEINTETGKIKVKAFFAGREADVELSVNDVEPLV